MQRPRPRHQLHRDLERHAARRSTGSILRDLAHEHPGYVPRADTQQQPERVADADIDRRPGTGARRRRPQGTLDEGQSTTTRSRSPRVKPFRSASNSLSLDPGTPPIDARSQTRPSEPGAPISFMSALARCPPWASSTIARNRSWRPTSKSPFPPPRQEPITSSSTVTASAASRCRSYAISPSYTTR